MSLKANYFKLGLFVIGAVVAAAALIIIIGSGRAFQTKIPIETYFNESVQGLDTAYLTCWADRLGLAALYQEVSA